jgi:hypothetical protein
MMIATLALRGWFDIRDGGVREQPFPADEVWLATWLMRVFAQPLSLLPTYDTIPNHRVLTTLPILSCFEKRVGPAKLGCCLSA